METYNKYALIKLVNRIEEICSDPYALFQSYVLNSMIDNYCEDDEGVDGLIGKEIPADDFDKLHSECFDSFLHAKDSDGLIDIQGRGYVIRKAGTVDVNLLGKSIQFERKSDNYIVSPGGFKKIELRQSGDFQSKKQEYQEDQDFVRKVITLALDDENDGWNKLTDMELIVYLWVYELNKAKGRGAKINDYYLANWYKESVLEYTDIKLSEIRKCFSQRIRIIEMADTPILFSKSKVMSWNTSNNQNSFIESVDPNLANSFWDELLKTKFTNI